MIGASIVTPGGSDLLPLPRNSPARRMVRTSRIAKGTPPSGGCSVWGPWAARLKPVYLGDDLHCCQPVCEAMRNVGGNFLLACKPGSHTTLCEWIHGAHLESLKRTERAGGARKRHYHYRWMNDLPLRDGRDAMLVNWFEVTVTSETGRQLCHGSFATDLPVGRDTVAELATCARTRWTVETGVLPELEKFCHLEHCFGHGRAAPANVLAIFNLIALLMQSACEMMCGRWQAARRQWVARCQMLDHAKTLVCYVVYQSWDDFLEAFAAGTPPARPPHITASTMLPARQAPGSTPRQSRARTWTNN